MIYDQYMKISQQIFTPLNTKRAFEEIADQIRQLIYSGVFRPGDKLPSERELAIQFRAGRMVVREALRTLEQSGLIYVKHGSLGGAFIKQADSSVITRSISDMMRIGNLTLQELTEARLGIEMVILEFVFSRISQKDYDLLVTNIEDSEQQISSGVRPLEEHLSFHLLLAKASKNTLFESIIESIMNTTRSFLLAVEPEREYLYRVLNYHKEIYRALERRELVAAKQKMREHLLDANQKLSGLVRQTANG